jgi:hypothetical protein
MHSRSRRNEACLSGRNVGLPLAKSHPGWAMDLVARVFSPSQMSR